MPSRILLKPLGTLAAVRSSRFRLFPSSRRPPRGLRHRLDDVRGMRTRRRQRDVFRQPPKKSPPRHVPVTFAARSVPVSSRRSRGDSILNSRNEFHERSRRSLSLYRSRVLFVFATTHERVTNPESLETQTNRTRASVRTRGVICRD